MYSRNKSIQKLVYVTQTITQHKTFCFPFTVTCPMRGLLLDEYLTQAAATSTMQIISLSTYSFPSFGSVKISNSSLSSASFSKGRAWKIRYSIFCQKGLPSWKFFASSRLVWVKMLTFPSLYNIMVESTKKVWNSSEMVTPSLLVVYQLSKILLK